MFDEVGVFVGVFVFDGVWVFDAVIELESDIVGLKLIEAVSELDGV